MGALIEFLDSNLEDLFSDNTNSKNCYLLIDIGIEIKNKRKACKLSQKQLSERCGISQANISKIEKGYLNITINQLIRIANALELKIKLEME